MSVKWLALMFTVVLLSHLPLLYWHLCSVLAKPHYQFVVLLPVAILALAWQRLKDDGWPRPAIGPAGVVIALVSLAALALATFVWSPWLGSLAAMLAVLAAVASYGGWPLARRLFPAWLILGFAVALPFDLDNSLIQELRQQATAWTSAVLDLLGIRHLVEGNVIRLPGKAFFVADACTGIRSLFVVAASALFLGFWHHRRTPQLIVLMIFAAMLVMLENVSRLVAVVAFYDWGYDASEGWRHSAMGGLAFIATLALLWSADQFVSAVVPQYFRFWRRPEPLEAERKTIRSPAAAECNHHAPFTGRPMIVVLIGFMAVGLWQVARTPAGTPQLSQVAGNPFTPIALLQAEAMPREIGPWVRADHRFEERSSDDPQGKCSQIWTYRRGDQTVEISVDYSYPAAHDACLCFENTGWTLERQRMIEFADSEAGIVEAYFRKPLVGKLFLLSSFFNAYNESSSRLYPRSGQAVDERVGARMMSFLRRISNEPPAGTKMIAGPVAQIRLAVTSQRTASDQEAEEFVEFYRQARVLLRDASLAQCQSLESSNAPKN